MFHIFHSDDICDGDNDIFDTDDVCDGGNDISVPLLTAASWDAAHPWHPHLPRQSEHLPGDDNDGDDIDGHDNDGDDNDGDDNDGDDNDGDDDHEDGKEEMDNN